MAPHLTQHRAGFGPGKTAITRLDDLEDPTGIALSVWKLPAGVALLEQPSGETALLMIDGLVEVEVAGQRARFERRSLFDQGPAAVHLPADAELRIRCVEATELLVCATANRETFPARIIRSVPDEWRGAGKVHETANRIVRTLFDRSSADPAAELVLGEVVTLPGRWSSYPPHHHPQPEIYHYRFTRPEGFGHAELGETVLKIRHHDTVKILGGVDHPQCAAPGYGMYYAWVIRHLPDQPYEAPLFDPVHRWTMEDGALGWWPKGMS